MSLSKLFQRIIWHNNTTPAINEDNLNAMSKAIDDIDDRVILIGDDVVTVIPQIQAYLEQAESIVEAVEELSQNPPYIGANGNWYVFDTTLEAYKDSGVDASITVDIADITMIAEGAQPYVTNTGTSTDPIFHLFLPRSPQGATGNGISNIAKTSTQGLVDTYTITMTDGTTYTFTVTNGQNGSGTGDMLQSDYDNDSAVKNAGGIADYVEGEVEPMLNVLGAKNIFPNRAVTETILGVTFTVNKDGTITANGTYTSTGAYLLSDGWNSTNVDWVKPFEGKTVRVSGIIPNVSLAVRFYDENNVELGRIITDYNGNEGVGVIPSNIANYTAYLFPNQTLTLTNAVFKPMMRLASIQDDTYEPYSMTNQQITPYALSQSNPNLLDNPWFTINQRGQSSYTNTWQYCLDRWYLANATSVVINNDGTITINGKSDVNSLIFEILDEQIVTRLTGEKVTISVLMSDGTVISKTGIFTNSSYDFIRKDDANYHIAIDLSNAGIGGTQFRIKTLDANNITIRAAKLELGSVSTLAQDTAPNYATELLKCQRYFYKLQASTTDDLVIGNGYAISTTNGRIKIDLPTEMRAIPTLAISNYIGLVKSSGVTGATTGNVIMGQNKNSLILNLVSSYTVNEIVCARLDASDSISFSADL